MSVFMSVFKRELKSYFTTPLALVFLTVFLVLNGFFTFKLGQFYELGQADLRAFFTWHPWLYLFIVPAVSMRLWAEERKSGTIELLFTLPVSLFEATAGKFVAAWLFIGLGLVLTFPIVCTVADLGSPDFGAIFASYIGSFLMAGAFLAVGICVSAATNNQVISFVISTAICLVLILMGFGPVVSMLHDTLPAGLVDAITNLSIPMHFEAIYRGVIDFRDLLYFASLMFICLVASAIILDKGKAD